jgi:hypothetical protein
MSEPILPPLPEVMTLTIYNTTPSTKIFTDYQMTAYGQQCYAAGVQDGKELAVRVALAMAADRRRDLQGLSLVPPAALTVQH